MPGYGWPERPPELRRLLEEYYEAISGLGERLRRLFALALDLPEDWFEDKFRDHSSSIRVVNYPAPEGEPEPGQLRAGAHTDYGCMTILRTEDAAGGLQVQTRAGEWLDVHAVPGSFVVNLGRHDGPLDERSVGARRSTAWPFRPRTCARGSRRQTIVFFHDPRADAVIECIPGCGTPRYEPVTALEHVNAKAAGAHTRCGSTRTSSSAGRTCSPGSGSSPTGSSTGRTSCSPRRASSSTGPPPPAIYLTGCGDSHYAGLATRHAFEALERHPDAGPAGARALALRRRVRACRLVGRLRLELGEGRPHGRGGR